MQEVYQTLDGKDVVSLSNKNSSTVLKLADLLENAEVSVYVVKQVVKNPIKGIVEYPIIYGGIDVDFYTKILNIEELNKVYKGIEKVGSGLRRR